MSAIEASRDVRVDFLRGIALLVIFVDHIDGNILARVTYRLSGFADAAEWFVLLSGYVVGIAYGRAVERNGAFRTQAKACYRAGELYVAHIATLGIALALFHRMHAGAAGTLRSAQGSLDYTHLYDNGLAALWEVVTLRHLPPLFDILPAYMLFILAGPAYLVALRRFGWQGPLAASAVLYAIPLIVPGANLPNLPDGHWYLNPLSWQFLFFIGVSAGACGWLRKDLNARPQRLMRAALAVFGTGFVVKAVVVQTTHDASLVPWVGKVALEPVLLLHFLSLVYLVLWLLPRRAPVLARAWVEPLVACGRHPLPIFCGGIVLSVAGSVLVANHPSLVSQLGVSATGCAALIGIAWFIDAATGAGSRRASPAVTPAAVRMDQAADGSRERDETRAA